MASRRVFYRYRQHSPWASVLAFIALAVVWSWTLWAMLSGVDGWMHATRLALAVTIVVVLLEATFSSMTIVVRSGEIVWWLGMGWPRSHMPLERLADASATRSTVLQGWGIHLTRAGWLWSVRGLNAVRLRTATRHGAVLGTDRPQELLDAIARARWAGLTP